MDKKATKNTSKDAQAKAESLKNAIAQIEKDYGKGALMRLGEKSNLEIEAQSTGALNLDMALGIGGLPKGRIVEIFGPESSGKTTITLMIAAQSQKDGGVVAFVDAEHALDPDYAKKLGVDIDELLVSQPDNGEQALEIVEALVRSNALDLIIVDSVAALVPKAEIDGEMGDSHVGLQARLMSQALRKLAGIVNKTNTIVIFINQLREKVGVMFGNPETTTGGRALKFYSSVRMDIRKGEAIKQGAEIVGSKTKVKVVKNKVAPPFKTAEFDIMFGQGVSTIGIVLDMAIENNLLKKSGAWISYNGEKIAQGRENGKEYLVSHPDLLESLKAQIIDIYESKDTKDAPVSSDDIDDEDDDTFDFLLGDDE